MILYLLIVFLSLPLNNAKVEIENKGDSVADDEEEFINGRYIITKEEVKRARKIIEYNRMETYTIEVLVMLDFSIYNWWLNLFRGDSKKTVSALYTFYANIFQKVKVLYNQVVIRGVRYDLEVVDIKIAKSKSEVPFVENKYKISETEVNIDTVLRNLTSWLQNERKRLPRHDVFAFYTKYQTGFYHGLAWPMAACTEYGVSVSREFGFYDTFHLTVHEIGHNLGSHHDVSINCTYKDQYIMAEGYEFFTKRSFPNRYKFSTCSLDYFEGYINKLNLEYANCLVIKSAKTYFKMDQFTKVPLGTQFSIDRHCQIIQGPNSFFCAGGGDVFKKMCWETTCWNDTAKICQRIPRSAPADGTPCESGRSCKKETCLPDPKVRSGQENCFYGDWKGMIYDENGRDISCNDVKRDRTFLCYRPENAEACCETCSKIYEPEQRGCEYGDKIYGCKRSECTYDKVSTCCKTCKANVSDPCQFGDKASWCSSLKPPQCYVNKDTCCKTCRNWLDNTRKGCEYGDKIYGCKRSECTYDKVSTCCKTCKANVSDPCQFGDKAPWCSSLKRFQCYANEDTCCKTCRNWLDNTKKDCRYGDKNDICESRVKKSPTNCLSASFRSECCSSCELIKALGCIDLDPDFCSSIKARHCYPKNVQEKCCKSCQHLKKTDAPQGCEYGDKQVGCKTFHCLNLKEMCCYTCRNYN